jgi:hypothetical protein
MQLICSPTPPVPAWVSDTTSSRTHRSVFLHGGLRVSPVCIGNRSGSTHIPALRIAECNTRSEQFTDVRVRDGATVSRRGTAPHALVSLGTVRGSFRGGVPELTDRGLPRYDWPG